MLTLFLADGDKKMGLLAGFATKQPSYHTYWCVYKHTRARYQAFRFKSNSPSDTGSITWGLSENCMWFCLLYPGSEGICDLAAISKRFPLSSTLLLYLKDHTIGRICNVRLHCSVFICTSLIACTSFNNNKLESQQVLDGTTLMFFFLLLYRVMWEKCRIQKNSFLK